LFDRDEVQKASPWFEFHQKINIAFQTAFTAGYRTKNPHILGAVSGGDSQYFVTLVLQDFARGHNRFSLGVILCYRKEPGKEINDNLEINNNHDNRGQFPRILDFLFLPFCLPAFLHRRLAPSCARLAARCDAEDRERLERLQLLLSRVKRFERSEAVERLERLERPEFP
jgi:hypothetical protein